MHNLYHLTPTVYLIVQAAILLIAILFWLALGTPEVI